MRWRRVQRVRTARPGQTRATNPGSSLREDSHLYLFSSYKKMHWDPVSISEDFLLPPPPSAPHW